MSDPGASGSTSIPIGVPTLAATFQTILTTHQSKPLSQPYYHPFAPSSPYAPGSKSKGKGRADVEAAGTSVEDQITALRRTIGSLKDALVSSSGTGEKDGARLIRALKEVNTHQSALLPPLSSIQPFPQLTPPPVFPSSHLNLHPTALLQSLATSTGLQTFLEDSQFGLLKTSLAIAGTRFVVDVDLEADATPGEEGDVDDDEPMATPVPTSALIVSAGRGVETDSGSGSNRGTVRLSKITASHVTPTGGTGKSDRITRVLRVVIVAYLDLWNDHSDANDSTIEVYEKERAVRQLEDELRALKELDDIEQSDVDWFEELEAVAKGVQDMIKPEASTRLYPVERATVFPTFQLLDNSNSSSSEPLPNPTFRIRPSWPSERVPSALLGQPTADETMELDQPADGQIPNSVASPWLRGQWILEYVGSGDERGGGLVVRRNWLNVQRDASGDPEAHNATLISQGGIRVENLLYPPQSQSTQALPQQGPQPFPYTAMFVHESQTTDKAGTASLAQHWSMAQAGPVGWLVGRVGVSRGKDGLVAAVDALRSQVVLNQLFASVFKSGNLQVEEQDINDVDDDAEDLEDWLSAFPLSVAMQEEAVSITFPRPYSGGNSVEVKDVEMVLRPSREAPYVSVVVSGAEGIVMERSRDLVQLVDQVERQLRRSAA